MVWCRMKVDGGSIDVGAEGEGSRVSMHVCSCEKSDQSPIFTLPWDNVMCHTAVQPSLHEALAQRLSSSLPGRFEICVPFPGEPRFVKRCPSSDILAHLPRTSLPQPTCAAPYSTPCHVRSWLCPCTPCHSSPSHFPPFQEAVLGPPGISALPSTWAPAFQLDRTAQSLPTS